jgi:tungstate transport system ATP-binding protein
MAPSLLTLRNIRVCYGAATVLDIPALDIHSGETLAIIGANGAGKSTLLRVIGFLQRPTSGSVCFLGEAPTAQNSLTLRRRIAHVLQAPLLLDDTVYGNAALGLKLRGLDRKQIQKKLEPWLERLGIANIAMRSARTLSGGEARRTSLARALVLEPELLLLDEPFSALDAPTRKRLLSDFKEILRLSDAAVVIVTHDVHEAVALAKHIAVLSRGKLLQSGPAEEVCSRPANQEVADLVSL